MHGDRQVMPSPSVVAHDLERQLRGLLEPLERLEQQLRPGQDQIRADAVAVAREQVQQAIEALELAASRQE
jgi:hypothetical protein